MNKRIKRFRLGRGKINKYGFLYLPKQFFERAGLPPKVDIPVTIYLEENQLIAILPKPEE